MDLILSSVDTGLLLDNILSYTRCKRPKTRDDGPMRHPLQLPTPNYSFDITGQLMSQKLGIIILSSVAKYIGWEVHGVKEEEDIL